MMKPLRLGISACLLGQKVRYDGQHKLDHYLTDVLGRYVDWIPVCPEVECGLPVPREAMRLVGDDPASPRLLTIRTGIDHTERMQTWTERRLDELAKLDLHGFVFKSKSPSSGLFHVKVYNRHGNPSKIGVGLFARAFRDRFPLLPMEEEGRLNDPLLRENFIERVFALARWREYENGGGSLSGLMAFHTRHKLQLMAHSPEAYRELGRLTATVTPAALPAVRQAYLNLFLAALALMATVRKNINVMQHIMGYFKKQLTGEEKRELLDLLDAYRAGTVPQLVPLTMLNHYIRKYRQPYLAEQTYLHPHPDELSLRNHA